MESMDNSEFIARALSDYLRPLVGDKEVAHITEDILEGESDGALFEAVGIAQHFGIALPPIFREKISQIENMPLNLLPALLEQIDILPPYWQKAS